MPGKNVQIKIQIKVIYQGVLTTVQLFRRLKDNSTPDFSTPSFNARLFNHELFNHELFNPGYFNHELEKVHG